MAAAALAYAPITAQAQTCGEIELGSAISITGKYSQRQEHKNGYKFALKKLNDAGGVKIGGKAYKLEVKYYDDESTPARTAQLLERLINQDGIKYVLGPYGSPDQGDRAGHGEVQDPDGRGRGRIALPLHARLQVQFGISDLRAISVPGHRPGRRASRRRTARTRRPEGRDVFQNDPFSLDVRPGVEDQAKKYGMKIVVDDRMPRDLSDISATLTKVKALKPDVLIVSGHEKGAATAARQMTEMHIHVPLVGVTHCESAR